MKHHFNKFPFHKQSMEDEKRLQAASSHLKRKIIEMQKQLQTQDLIIEAISNDNSKNTDDVKKGKNKMNDMVRAMKNDGRNIIIVILLVIAVILSIYLI